MPSRAALSMIVTIFDTARSMSRPKCAARAPIRMGAMKLYHYFLRLSGTDLQPDLLGQELGVARNGCEAARTPGVLPRQAEEVEAGYRRNAAVVRRVSFTVERAHPQPSVVGTKTDGPDNRRDVQAPQVQFGRLLLGAPDGNVALLCGRVYTLALDVGVDVVLDGLGDGIRSVEGYFECRRELQNPVLYAQQASVELHSLGGECAQVDVSTTVATCHVVIRVLAFSDATGLILDGTS